MDRTFVAGDEKATQKLATTGREKINMSFTPHASGLQKDSNLMSSMCHGDVTITTK